MHANNAVTGEAGREPMPWARTLGAVTVAGAVGVAIGRWGRAMQWPHSLALAFAMFLFTMGVLQPSRHEVRPWWRPTGQRLVIATVIAAIGGLVHALLLGT